jgi:hypothetical protein
LSGAASTVEEREKLAQAHVTDTHNFVTEVALPSVTAAGVVELSDAASTAEEREKLAQAHVTDTHNFVVEVALSSVTEQELQS